jgi:hypothetical protein
METSQMKVVLQLFDHYDIFTFYLDIFQGKCIIRNWRYNAIFTIAELINW